jgi:hypothetical protein
LTITSLRREPPMLEPDDAFVARLAELARASHPTPSGVAVLGGATGRSLAAAAAVAAIAAGTAVAAGQMNHSHPLPAPPVSTQETDLPTAPDSPSDRQSHEGRQVGAGHKDGPTGSTENVDTTAPVLTFIAETPGGHHQGPNPGPGSDDPATEDPGDDDPGDDSAPSDEPSEESSGNPSASPSEDPNESSGERPSGAPSSESSDGTNDGGDGGNRGSGSGDSSPDSESAESSGTGGPDGSGLMEIVD